MGHYLFSFFIALSLVTSSSASTALNDAFESNGWIATFLLIGGIVTGGILGYFVRFLQENKQEKRVSKETIGFTGDDDDETQQKTFSTLNTGSEQHFASAFRLDEEEGRNERGMAVEHKPAPPPLHVYGDDISSGKTKYSHNSTPAATVLYEGLYGEGTYEGELKDGKPHGRGIMRYANGDIYLGQFRNANRHGKGIYTMIKGGVYTGSWKGDRRHGMGNRRYPNGDVYYGEWERGKRHGLGTMTYTKGGVYEGGWRDDQKHGEWARL